MLYFGAAAGGRTPRGSAVDVKRVEENHMAQNYSLASSPRTRPAAGNEYALEAGAPMANAPAQNSPPGQMISLPKRAAHGRVIKK